MVSMLARAALVACAVLIAPWAAQAQAVDGYKPPSAARQSPEPASTQAVGGAQAVGPQAVAGQRAAASGAQKTIGLISVVGETFTVKKVGVTVLGNEEQGIPIAQWRLDESIASKVGAILKKNFRIKRIAVPGGTYRKYETTLRDIDYRERHNKLVRDFAASQKCDYYLLVAPGGSVVGATNQGVGGIGLLRTTALFSPKEHVHALTELTAYDAQFKVLRSEPGSIGQDTFLATIKGPHLLLEEPKLLPPDPKAAASDPRAREIAWGLLEQSLAITVPKLFAVD
jgi:hypothetical protein